MTLLDELRWLRDDARRIRRWSWGQKLSVATLLVVLAAALSALVYRENYGAALQRGMLGGLGAESGLLTVNDGIRDTGYVITAKASPSRQAISLYNAGRFGVKILALGDDLTEGPQDLSLAVPRMGVPGNSHLEDSDSMPFHPFVLGAEQNVTVLLSVSTRPCRSYESGSETSVSALRVRYSFWGQEKETWLPLELPIFRVCPEGRLRPHVVPAPQDAASERFVSSGYDFGVPRGWTAKPLENFGGPMSLASWTAPGGKSEVVYELNGGSAGMEYMQGKEATIEDAAALSGCDVAAFAVINGSAFRYTCRTVHGLLRAGVVRRNLHDHSFERIEISAPDAELVAAFVALDNIKT